MDSVQKLFHDKYKEFNIPVPKVHFVLGSVLCTFLNALTKTVDFSGWERRGRIHFSDIPDLNTVSAFSHLGYYEYFYHIKTKISICFQLGRLHGYEGIKAQEVVKTVTRPCQAGTKYFVLSNIAGGLKKKLSVGSVVAITDHINLTGQTPLIGVSKKSQDDSYFVDMKDAYNPQLTASLIKQLEQQKINISKGIYIGVLGPQFETPSEVSLFAQWGDVVGMSTVWEVIALRYLKATVCATSLIANPACGIGESVMITDTKLKPYCIKMIKSFLNFAENLS